MMLGTLLYCALSQTAVARGGLVVTSFPWTKWLSGVMREKVIFLSCLQSKFYTYLHIRDIDCLSVYLNI